MSDLAIHPVPRRHPPHRGALARVGAELRLAAAEIAGQSSASVCALRRPTSARVLVCALWLVGIVGDGLTTVLMMRTGRFEESNGAAAVMMDAHGVVGWVVLSGAVCLALATLTLVRPRGTYATTAAGVAMVVCLGKVWMATGNGLLWWSTTR